VTGAYSLPMRTGSLFLPLRLLAAAVALTGCASSDSCGTAVVSRADPTVDFTAIGTFAFVPEEDYPDELPDDLPDDVVADLRAANDAMRRELIALGLTEVDPDVDDPDVFAFSLAASETENGIVWECVPGYVWWGGWGYVWDPCAWLRPIEVNVEIGSVLVGLADPVEEAAVFGGVVQGVIPCGDAEERLVRGIARIFDAYPADQTGD